MKLCSMCDSNPPVPGQRYCQTCRNWKQREYRRTNPLEGEARKRANCRSYLHAYVKRGAIIKGPCEVCGTTKVIEAHHDDYDQPLAVRWLCRPHHVALTCVEANKKPPQSG